MKSESSKEITIILTLDEIEARWLKSIMQNPLHNQGWEEESQTDKTMRAIFYDALEEVDSL